MKLWRLSEPFDPRFARAVRVGGTWQEGEYKTRNGTLTVEWEPDSDVIGDFTWPGFDTDIVIGDRVGEVLREAGVTGFELRPVQMRENSEPAKRRSRKPRVRLPYQGPQLWDFWITAWAHADRDQSTIREVKRGDGSVDLELVGAQRREKTWDQQRMELVSALHPRIAGQGLFVPRMHGVFRVEEFPAWVFCSDDVKRLIEEHGFTNVSFLEMGELL